MKITPVADLGRSPARINRKTGEIFINCRIWDKIPKQERKVILLHEKGHYELNTSNEFQADNFAFDHYAGTEKYSLKSLVNTLSHNLDIENRQEHQKRFEAMAKKVLMFDYKNNQNINALKLLNKMETLTINELPVKSNELLKEMFIDFLKSKNIEKIEDETVQRRQELLVEFFAQPHVLYLMQETQEIIDSNQENSLFGRPSKEERQKKKEERKKNQTGTGREIIGGLVSSFAPAIGTAISGIATALGVVVPPEAGTAIANLAGGSITNAGKAIADAKEKASKGEEPPEIKVPGEQSKKNERSNPRSFHQQPYHPKGRPNAGTRIGSGSRSSSGNKDESIWNETVKSGKLKDYKNYLKKFPKGIHKAEAETKIKGLKKKKLIIFGGTGLGTVVLIVVIILLVKK